MLDPAATLALAEQVADAANRLGFDTALIGAAALAVHRYTRGTEDIDLAVAVNPSTQLSALAQALSGSGLRTRLRLPDDDDPLGGVLTIWASEDDGGEPVDIVEVVNFCNPSRVARNPARDAIARATTLAGGRLRCVGLEDLIALKLYAGGLTDLADVAQLLARNPEADLDAVRAVAGQYDEGGHLDALITEAARIRARRYGNDRE
jgi:hypothetical protein